MSNKKDINARGYIIEIIFPFLTNMYFKKYTKYFL